MAGVTKEFRKKGILKTLIQELKQKARKNGYEYLTINTWTRRFPAMVDYFTKYDFERYKEEELEWEKGKTELKYFYRVSL